jgi:hypothetical protein
VTFVITESFYMRSRVVEWARNVSNSSETMVNYFWVTSCRCICSVNKRTFGTHLRNNIASIFILCNLKHLQLDQETVVIFIFVITTWSIITVIDGIIHLFNIYIYIFYIWYMSNWIFLFILLSIFTDCRRSDSTRR